MQQSFSDNNQIQNWTIFSLSWHQKKNDIAGENSLLNVHCLIDSNSVNIEKQNIKKYTHQSCFR